MEYGKILPLDFDKKTARWLTGDLTKRNPFAKLDVRKDDVVLDCGGCIGSFAAAALETGASRVVVVEPMVSNLSVLRENLARYGSRVEVIAAALIPTDKLSVTMSVASFSGCHSMTRDWGGRRAVVSGCNFRKLLLRVNPQVLKIDVEGAEYQLLDTLEVGDLLGIRSLAVEFHRKELRRNDIKRAEAIIERDGLKLLHATKISYIYGR